MNLIPVQVPLRILVSEEFGHFLSSLSDRTEL